MSTDWVLIVEDDPDHAFLIEAEIQRSSPDIRVVTRFSADQALEVVDDLGATPPSVLVLDVDLEGENALWLADAMRDAFGPPSPAVVIVTALAHDDVRAEALARGVDAFVTKPLDPRRARRLFRDRDIRWEIDELPLDLGAIHAIRRSIEAGRLQPGQVRARPPRTSTPSQ